MTVVHPNHIVGINSITVQTGDSLSVHKADGSLIRTIVSNTGVSTFHAIEVSKGGGDLAVGVSTFFVDNSTGKNEIYAVGVEHGAELSAGVIQSGAGAGDLNGYDLTFTAMESFPALKLDAYTDTPFDNFTLTTVVE